ncbi:tRNA (guanine(46)-N(7))-methyltransferase TrmB [Oceanibacterium hippocampi]|uniref:tRNA (guanine-N(7)-)-methyltransferase n=1 Tax=Oceanibacterium hippocampi TaxID=745714 RepID=A0A1Y5RNT7_9PROT|nr:tRNA (guanine(46)-N(7))-methyltransferase TrmB [Oceanibacterium hippocampi]SLN19216.1 tRNA (guanine-N(7)-)-methyltransferase [Oceanibacterium hippocampi]
MADEGRPDVAPARSFGRRRGKPLRPRPQRLVDALLPDLRIALGDAAPGSLDPMSLFPARKRAIWLEIGFGGGEHLAGQAGRHPDCGLLGAEPFLNGVAKLLGAIDEAGLDNIRILDDDARMLLAALRPGSIERAFVLFPDPWPKSRHHRRRLVNRDTLDGLASALAPGAELRLATDHAEYGRWILWHLLDHPAFEWLPEGPGEWRRRPHDWYPTRYEEKALAGGASCLYLRAIRRPESGPRAPEKA